MPAALRAAPGVGRDFRNHTAFERAEIRFATVTENLGNRLSGPRANLDIAVDQTPSQPPSQMARNRAFAGCHKAGQDHFHRSNVVSREYLYMQRRRFCHSPVGQAFQPVISTGWKAGATMAGARQESRSFRAYDSLVIK